MIVSNSSVAMYEQIAQILRNEIQTEVFKTGEAIGTHNQLAERFQVSIITIRKAIELLCKENLLIIRQGKGTFVNTPVLLGEGNKLSALSAVMKKHNLEEEVYVPTMSTIKTPKHLPQNIQNALGEKCVYINRLHSINGVCISDYNLYLPTIYADKFTREEVTAHSIYYLYQNKLKVSLGRGVQTIKAEKALKEEAKLLSVDEGSPLLVLTRDSYSKNEELIEYLEAYCSPSHFSFKIELDLSID